MRPAESMTSTAGEPLSEVEQRDEDNGFGHDVDAQAGVLHLERGIRERPFICEVGHAHEGEQDDQPGIAARPEHSNEGLRQAGLEQQSFEKNECENRARKVRIGAADKSGAYLDAGCGFEIETIGRVVVHAAFL